MTTYAYFFEAKSIQSFILATNRLKEIVGASELVEKLTGSLQEDAQHSLLDDALDAIDGKNIRFSRKGGATFYAFSEDEKAIENLASLWPLLVYQFAPDLEFTQAKGEGENEYAAFETAHKGLLANRNRLCARLPQAGPFVRRNRRTGEPATDFSRSSKSQEPEPVDAATYRKLEYAERGQLAKRFADDSGKAWPVLLTPEEGKEGRNFPFKGEQRLVALIHADGNGLGQALIGLQNHAKENPGDYFALFSGFSKAVSEATQSAARIATTEVLSSAKVEGIYPARPIVLGGDDLTMIVRADLALDFTCRFLEAFAAESSKALAPLRVQFPFLPDCLTACAGIAYVKSSQPFYLSHGLAEDLCKHAKHFAKKHKAGETIPSTLSFHRVTTAMVDEYGEILRRELSVPLGKFFLRQTLECYALEQGHGLPYLKDLLELRNLLGDGEMARGPGRQVLGLIGQDIEQARRRYQRWREMMEKNTAPKLKAFDAILTRLLDGKVEKDLPYGLPVQNVKKDAISATPLGDVITLLSIVGE